MKCATGYRRATAGEGFWVLFSVLLFALSLMAASGCTDGGEASACDGCQQGCCNNGVCVPPGNLNDSTCGFGGMSCNSCIALGQTCNTAIGQCAASGNPVVMDPVATAGCNPPCDTFTQMCVAGGCVANNSNSVVGNCNPPCNTATEVCMGGRCEAIGGAIDNPSGGCVGCNPPNQCYDGGCVDVHSYCRKTCTGCCDARGACLAIGSDGGQDADACGKGGKQCISCLSARLDCNTERGECGSTGGDKLRICISSATIDSAYKDQCGAFIGLPWRGPLIGNYTPEVYVRFQVGSQVLATTAYGAVQVAGGDWNVNWAGECKDVDMKEAYQNAIQVVASDKNAGACGMDSHIGMCTTQLDGWSISSGRAFTLGGSLCFGLLNKVRIEVRPL